MAVERKQLATVAGLVLLYALAGALFAYAERETASANHLLFRWKASRAAEDADQPRILLVGGSNALWGYRSSLIERRTGRPTINLALENEADDPEVMRALALTVAGPGDVVVYSSVSFWNLNVIRPGPAEQILRSAGLARERSGWEAVRLAIGHVWLPWPLTRSFADSLPDLVAGYEGGREKALAAAYTTRGDRRICDRTDVAPQPFGRGPELAAYVAGLRKFHDRIRATGAELIVDPSWLLVQKDEGERWEEEFQPILDAVGAAVPVATKQLRDVLATNGAKFCDSPHHLDQTSAAQRSRKLVRFLNDHLQHADPWPEIVEHDDEPETDEG